MFFEKEQATKVDKNGQYNSKAGNIACDPPNMAQQLKKRTNLFLLNLLQSMIDLAHHGWRGKHLQELC